MSVIAYRDDTIDLDLEPLYPRLRLSSWQRGVRAEVLRDGAWRPASTTRGIRFIREDDGACPKRDPVARFLAEIPGDLLTLSLDCGGHQLAALRLLAAFPAARGLASMPNLLWLVARRLDARPLRDATIAAVLAQPRHQVLSWCLRRQVPKSALRLLARCTLDRSEHTVGVLRRVLGNERARRALAHVRKITTDHLWIVDRHPELLRFRFMPGALATATRSLRHLYLVYRRTLRFGALLGIPNVHAMVEAASYDEFVYISGAWEARTHERREFDAVVRKFGTRFPVPPLPGTAAIAPIVTTSELLAESRAMHHCVLNYTRQIHEGTRYVYRVAAPERATVMLQLPQLEIVEFAGRENTRVSEACTTEVEGWLSAHGRLSLR